MNSAANNLFNSPPASSISNNAVVTLTSTAAAPWFIIGGIVLLLVLAYILYQRHVVVDNTPQMMMPLGADWRAIEKAEKRAEADAKARGESAGFGENWCFVGEDVTGRWCVRVPQPDACSPERLFSTRPGCELVPASTMPLGLVAKGGAVMNPLLAAMHTK